MSNEVEKQDNSLWMIVGGCVIAMVAVVAFLKSEKSAHLNDGVVQQFQQETFQSLDKRHKNNASDTQKAGN